MAIRLVEGFDAIATSDLARLFTVGGGGNSVQTTTTRSGGRAAQINAGSGLTYAIGASSTTITAGGGFRAAGLAGGIILEMQVVGTATQGRLYLLNTGALEYRRSDGTVLATSTSLLSANTWYYLEISVFFSDTVGTIDVKVDGVSYISATGKDTLAFGSNANGVQFLAAGSSTGYWDDLYVTDGATGFLGVCTVATVVASSGNGTYTDFTPSSGTDHGAMVDDATPDNDTTYNASSTAGHVDMYNFAALGVTGTVKALELVNWCTQNGAGAVSVRGTTRISGTDYDASSSTALTTANYSANRTVWDTSPATSTAWTVSEIDGAEFGVEIVSASATARITQCHIKVLYVPTPAGAGARTYVVVI